MSEKERRKHPRAKLRQIAQVGENTEGGQQHETLGSTADVSPGGVRFEAKQGFGAGSDVKIGFAMGEEIIEANGNVVRFTIQEDGTVSMGIKFSDLPEDSRKLIDEYCKKKLGEQ